MIPLSCTIRVQLVTPAAIRGTNSRNSCIFKLTQCAAHWRHHRACFPATLFKAFLGCAQRCLPGAARVELAALLAWGVHTGVAPHAAPLDRDTHWQAAEWVPASSWDMPAYTAIVTSRSSVVGDKLIVNPGSVGQSRSGNAHASYAIWQEGVFTLHTTPYPVDMTIEKLRSLCYPPPVEQALIRTLRTGTLGPHSPVRLKELTRGSRCRSNQLQP
jgi:diadenosine tetraphosphatase ApaH/serine/threonine PP2A family protein phosphatase